VPSRSRNLDRCISAAPCAASQNGRNHFECFVDAPAGQKVLRHWIEARVHHLIVHRDDEHGVEVALHKRLEALARLAVDVAHLALWRRGAL
jgi:hypothetical protein